MHVIFFVHKRKVTFIFKSSDLSERLISFIHLPSQFARRLMIAGKFAHNFFLTFSYACVELRSLDVIMIEKYWILVTIIQSGFVQDLKLIKP